MAMIYNVSEKPSSWKEWILYPLQMLLSIFVATVLIASICNTPISSCLLGAGLATIIYQLVTKFRSPMFISSSGATVSAVVGAMTLSGVTNGYILVALGGVLIAVIYGLFALLIKMCGVKILNRIFPPTIVGSVTMVIGLNLASFIPGYLGSTGNTGLLIALFTMIVVAVSSHFFRGFWKTIPFLFGLTAGYLVALSCKLIDFSAFNNITWYPDVTFLKWDWSELTLSNVLSTVLLFTPVTLCALLEHYSDHMCLSNIIGQDLTKDPGLHRTLLGDGIASAIGTITCGLPNTSYGESVATIGFSKVASVWVSFVTALILIAMSFIGPVSALIQSIPSCVFAGCAMILYGYITCSGLKTLMKNKVDLEDNKNLIIVSVVLTVGVSGIFLFTESFAGVSLAMTLGVILNSLLYVKKATKK